MPELIRVCDDGKLHGSSCSGPAGSGNAPAFEIKDFVDGDARHADDVRTVLSNLRN
jgi:hypothetical protein